MAYIDDFKEAIIRLGGYNLHNPLIYVRRILA